MHSHSQAVHHRMEYDETTSCKMHNITNKLLVIGKYVRLPFTTCTDLLPVDCRKGCDETDFHKMSNETHKLLVIPKRHVETGFQKVCNITHSLLVIGKDRMRHKIPSNV